jgi:NTE family protein
MSGSAQPGLQTAQSRRGPGVTVAFALSGGANLGPMQAGTVMALMEAGIEPDLLVGTSVGALNAAFLATHPGLDGARDLMDTWAALHRREAFRFNLFTALAGFLGARDHLVSTRQFRRLIRSWLPVERIEQTPIALAVTATDAVTGAGVVLTNGDIVDALAASAAIPGLFPPVRVEGRWLVDGSLSASRPVLEAQALGATDVYVISTMTAPRLRPPRGAVALAMHSVALLTTRGAQDQLAAATARAGEDGGRVLVVPSAQPPAPGPFNFGQSAALAEAAYRRTRTWLIDDAPLRKSTPVGVLIAPEAEEATASRALFPPAAATALP